MGRQSAQRHLLIDCNPTQTIKFIVLCLHKQGHLIFKGLHQVAQYHAAWQRAAGFQLGGFAWREAVITGALPEVPFLVLPSDGWRVLPADLQVYPPIWRAGGRLANTLHRGKWLQLLTHVPLEKSRHFGDNILWCILVNEEDHILIKKLLKFVPKGLIDNWALIEIMAWCRIDNKPLSEPMSTQFVHTYMWHYGEMS